MGGKGKRSQMRITAVNANEVVTGEVVGKRRKGAAISNSPPGNQSLTRSRPLYTFVSCLNPRYLEPDADKYGQTEISDEVEDCLPKSPVITHYQASLSRATAHAYIDESP